MMAIDLGQCERKTPPAPPAESLGTVREGLVQLSKDVHALSYQLHPCILEDLGLAEALKVEAERFEWQGGNPILHRYLQWASSQRVVTDYAGAVAIRHSTRRGLLERFLSPSQALLESRPGLPGPTARLTAIPQSPREMHNAVAASMPSTVEIGRIALSRPQWSATVVITGSTRSANFCSNPPSQASSARVLTGSLDRVCSTPLRISPTTSTLENRSASAKAAVLLRGVNADPFRVEWPTRPGHTPATSKVKTPIDRRCSRPSGIGRANRGGGEARCCRSPGSSPCSAS